MYETYVRSLLPLLCTVPGLCQSAKLLRPREEDHTAINRQIRNFLKARRLEMIPTARLHTDVKIAANLLVSDQGTGLTRATLKQKRQNHWDETKEDH